MKRLIATLRQLGIEIPEDKQEEAKKVLSEQYKAVEEYTKTTSKLEEDRDNWKNRAEIAEEILKGFEGVDLQTIYTELESWRKKAEDTEKEMNRKLEERDFQDALKTALEDLRFTSEAAKKAVMAEIMEAGLKVKNGKILGLSDLIEQMKEEDPDAFVNEEEEEMKNGKPKFTTKRRDVPKPEKKLSSAELMKLKNEHPEIDIKQYM